MNNFTQHMNNVLPSMIDGLSVGEESTNLEKVERGETRPFYGIKDVTLGPGPIWSITFDYLKKGVSFSKFIDIMKGVEVEKQKRLARGTKSFKK
jgi:hypothetical protein